MACNVYKILKRELRISKRFLAAVAALVFMLFGLMNVVGFFLGVLLAMILDAIRKLVTDGKEKTIFSFR